MSFQKIHGGKSFSTALEMFEYFKSGDINRGRCWHEKKETDVSFVYVPAGTRADHFRNVARKLNGDLCTIRVHDVVRDLSKLENNKRKIEFFVEHEPREYEQHELRHAHFKVDLIQYGDAGIWGFLGAELIEVMVGGKKITTRYAMRKSISPFNKPHLTVPGKIWAMLGMDCPIYVLSQEVEGPKIDERIDAE